MKNGMKWYRRNPLKFLGGVQGLRSRELAIYTVVLDLIYMHGGSINNDPKWISGWISDVGSAACRRAIDELLERDLLELDGDKLTNQWARKMVLLDDEWSDETDDLDDIIARKSRAKPTKTKKISAENEQKTVEKRSKNSSFSDAKPNEINDPTSPSRGREKRIEKDDNDLHHQSSFLDDVNEPPKRKRKSVFPANWKPSETAIKFAIDKGFPQSEALNMGDACRDHHIARGTVFVDFDAAYRTWVQNQIRFSRGQLPARDSRGNSSGSRLLSRTGVN